MLNICLISFSLECVAAHGLVPSVEDYALVDGLAGHGVFHATNDLEGVVVELLGGGDGRVAEAVLEVVLEQEGVRDFVEVERVLVVQVQLDGLLDW